MVTPDKNHSNASDLLKSQKENIIRDWRKVVIHSIPAAQNQSKDDLNNGLIDFLDVLGSALSSPDANAEYDIIRISHEHGKQRTHLSQYTLQDMLKEYQLLRVVILKRLEEEVPLSIAERDIVLAMVEQGMAESGSSFIEHLQIQKKSAEERYGIVVEGVRDHAIMRISHDGIILEWNAGAENIFQYTKDEIIGKNGNILFNQEDLAKNAPAREMNTAIKEGKAEDKRWHVKKDGSLFFANGILNPLVDESGNIFGFVKVLTDETEKQLQERVRETFMNLPGLLLSILTHDGLIKDVNDSWKSILGWNKDDLISSPLLSFVHEEDQIKTRDAIAAIKPRSMRNRFSTNNGFYKWLEWTIRPLGNEIYAFARDVTELVETEHALKDSEERFQKLFQYAPVGVGEIDPATRKFIKVNKKYCQMLGYDAEELLNMSVEDVTYSEDREKDIKLLDAVYRTEKRYVRKDGSIMWGDLSATPILSDSGRLEFNAAVVQDITDRKNAEEKLREAFVQVNSQKTRLEEEQVLRERFVAALSHDLRTPLTAAKLSAQVLSRKISDRPELIKATLRISENMDRADRMIRDLLDATYIKAGQKLPLKIDHCNLRKLADEVIEEVSMLYGDRFEVMGDQIVEGLWDKEALKRVIENLVVNAIKYGSPGSPVTVRTEDHHEFVSLKVHNEGNPISPEDQAILFNEFKRTEAARSGGQKGWGLGLTLIKGIAEAHGGSASVESSAAEGTVFTVTLPKESGR